MLYYLNLFCSPGTFREKNYKTYQRKQEKYSFSSSKHFFLRATEWTRWTQKGEVSKLTTSLLIVSAT